MGTGLCPGCGRQRGKVLGQEPRLELLLLRGSDESIHAANTDLTFTCTRPFPFSAQDLPQATPRSRKSSPLNHAGTKDISPLSAGGSCGSHFPSLLSLQAQGCPCAQNLLVAVTSVPPCPLNQCLCLP